MHMVNTCVIIDDTSIGASIHEGTALIVVVGTYIMSVVEEQETWVVVCVLVGTQPEVDAYGLFRCPVRYFYPIVEVDQGPTQMMGSPGLTEIPT
jgi:hypothetical protein